MRSWDDIPYGLCILKAALKEKYNINVAGEGGEFESLVINGPIFKKKLEIKQTETIMENEFTGVYLIKSIK